MKHMSVFRLFLILAVLAITMFYSCQRCEDCGPSNAEPYVTLQFFNQDSINKVNDTLSKINSTLSWASDSLQVLEDSISIVQDSIANGAMDENYEEILSFLQKDTAEINDIINEYTPIKDVFTNQLNTLLAGKLVIDTVYAIGYNSFINFGYNESENQYDSLSEFRFPLDMNRDTTTYVIHRVEGYDTLTLSYLREEWVKERIIRVKAVNINAPEDLHTFDSLKIDCTTNPECISNATYIYAYY